MFSGIIEAVGKVVGLRAAPVGGSVAAATRLEIEAGTLFDELRDGASVAVNGACLTLADRRDAVGGFDVIPETWQKTTLQFLKVGDAVNLERSLRVADRLDGHFVQGHVDGVGTVDRVERAAGEVKVWVAADAELMPYVVRKGAIALDGTSLTVVEIADSRFSVALIPTTLQRTTLSQCRPGRKVNIETDILARIVLARLEALDRGEQVASSGGITWDRLREAGYLP
jgi:riboflavin synthase